MSKEFGNSSKKLKLGNNVVEKEKHNSNLLKNENNQKSAKNIQKHHSNSKPATHINKANNSNNSNKNILHKKLNLNDAEIQKQNQNLNQKEDSIIEGELHNSVKNIDG